MKAFRQHLPALKMAAVTALTVLSAYTVGEHRGFWATLPLLTLAALICALLQFTPWRTGALAFGATGAFALVDGHGLFYAAALGALAALTVLLAHGAIHRITGGKQQKKPLWLALGLALALITPLGQGIVFGTPWANRQTEERVRAYLEEKYPQQGFEQITVSYHIPTGEYYAFLDVRDPSGATVETRLALREDQVTQDGFFEQWCRRDLEQLQGRLVQTLRRQYPSQPLLMRCERTALSPQELSGLAGSYGSVPDWLSTSAQIDLGFKFELADTQSFLACAKEYVSYLKQEGFPFASLRILGGSQGTYRYCLTVTPDTPPEDFALQIKTCQISMEIPSLSMEYSYLY